MKKIKSWYLPDNEQHLIKYIERDDGYQKNLRDHALSFVKNYRTALDIGAHVGLWARDLCKKFKHVEAFEPIPDHQACFNKNLNDSRNFTMNRVALGDESKLVYFDYDGANTGHSRVHEDPANLIGSVCAMARLDSYGFEEVDFIKIDCEGYEYFVLKGGRETILKNRPVINIEQKKATYPGINQYSACEYLKSLGMKEAGRMKDEFVFTF